jgi:Fe-S-cluster-containing hydrogenase component 2
MSQVRTVSIDVAQCDRSPGCPARRACPRGAIVPVSGGAYPGANGFVVDDTRCTGCAVCVLNCPGRAVRVE